MTLKRSSGGSWVGITTTLKRRASGAWVDIDIIRRRSGGSWTTLWSRIQLSDQNIYYSRPIGTTTAGYRLNSSGIVEARDFAGYSTLETWLVSGTASNYEARATVLVGSVSTGTTGSWLSLGSSREWTVTQASMGTKQCQLLVEIRNASTLAVVDSAAITLEAERT